MKEQKNEMNRNRTEEFKRNEQLELYLKNLNSLLDQIEEPETDAPDFPLVFIVGVPRCGSTLLLQILAKNNFAYPSNIIARFYNKPYIGALVQKVLAEEDRDKQIDINKKISFNSKLGRTYGGLNVSEFWYYWRRFFDFGEIQKLSEEKLWQTETDKFKNGLYQLIKIYQKPLALKAMILNWHLDYLSDIIKNSIFVYIKRDLKYIAQSLLQAREKFFGGYQNWFSYKPPEYKWLKELEPEKQVAGQAFFTQEAIENGLQKIDSQRVLDINYENLCQNPKGIYSLISKKVSQKIHYSGPQTFTISNKIKIDQKKFKKLDQYIRELKNE